MKKEGKVMSLVNKAVKFTEDHQREILLGSAMAGTVITAVLSWKAGIKADKILKEQHEKMEEIEEEDISDEEFAEKKKELTIDTVKKMTPIVAPPVIAGAGTIISVIGGYKAASTQIATLSALYSMSEKALADYQDKAKEIIGQKKSQQITDEVKADKVKNNPPKDKTVVNTGRGTTLCLDEMSGRYFYSDAEEIRKSCNIINKRLMDEYYISLNELYSELGLKEIPLGDDIGFNIDDGLIDIEHLFSATLYNDVPVLVLNYDVSAKYMEHRGGMFR